MPIKPENRSKYPSDWKDIRQRILERAGHTCERCKAKNGTLIARGHGKDAGAYMTWEGAVHSEADGELLGYARGSEWCTKGLTKIVLTIAHLDHDLVDHTDSNLQALCQKCHLAHDRHSHIASRRARKATADLFA